MSIDEKEMPMTTPKRKFDGRPSVTEKERDKETEAWRLSNNRREVDLISVIPNTKTGPTLLQVETKSAANKSAVNKATKAGVKQLQWFKKQSERTHTSYLRGIRYVGAIALPNSSPMLQHKCYCDLPVEVEKVHEPGNNHDREYRVCQKSGKGLAANSFGETNTACEFFSWVQCSTLLVHNPAGNCCTSQPDNVTSQKPVEKREPRQFQVCSGQPDQQCEFFRWLEDTAARPTPVAPIPIHKEGTFCGEHFLLKPHLEGIADLDTWWKKLNIHESKNAGSSPMSASDLRRRLIALSSMVFSRLPRLLSVMSADSQMILLW